LLDLINSIMALSKVKL